MPALLTDAQIEARLKRLDGWKKEGDFIVRTFQFREFMDGIGFINSVAKTAEEEEHHPDIYVRYTSVRLSLQTHSEGGVTEWDIALANKIDKLAEGRGKSSRVRPRAP